MIRRIRIRGYKSLRDVELSELSRLVLLFGPNSAGKSNLLDALDLLSRLAREDTLLTAFQRHRGNRLERPQPVRWFFYGARDTVEDRELSFEIDLDLQDQIVEALNRDLAERERQAELQRPYTRVTQSRLRYRLKIRYEEESRALQVTHESLVPLRRDGRPKENTVPYIKHEEGSDRISVKLERQAHPRIYDLPRGRTLLSEIGDSVNHPHLVAASQELGSVRVYYVEPARMRSAVNDIEATDPGPHGEQLASFFHWLNRKHPIAFRNLVHNLGRLVPGIEGLDVREGAEGFLELWVAERDRGEFPASMISEGTLRLLCLLGIAATPRPPAIVGYEEPENGVNPARLGEMLSILENASESPTGTQFVLTTHSREVIDFFTAATRILCRQSAQGSEYVPFENLPLLQATELEENLGSLSRQEVPLGVKLGRGDFG